MSRLAKRPVEIPSGITVQESAKTLKFKGPKGEYSLDLTPGVKVSIENNQMMVEKEDSQLQEAFLGLDRSRIINAIEGVQKGFEKVLDLVGVGFKAVVKGSSIELHLGYSQPRSLEIPKGISVRVEKNVQVIISGIDKQFVGQFAASIRSVRKPEPYKGKGVLYKGETIRRKAGKKAKG